MSSRPSSAGWSHWRAKNKSTRKSLLLWSYRRATATNSGSRRFSSIVLFNLVGNAIGFTDTGEVSIKGSSGYGTFNVSVRDTGPGISEADQVKLFQEFQQADNSITRKKGGTWLGLEPISKLLAGVDPL
jgi:C4-dicarboxylate-specific signal transduction histidine kinase